MSDSSSVSPPPAIPDYVVGWAAEHDAHVRRGDERAAHDLRERIVGAGFSLLEGEEGSVVVPAQRYALVDPEAVPDHRDEPDAVDVSVLLLLRAPEPGTAGTPSAPITAARRRGQDGLVADASRCLAAVLGNRGAGRIEVVICDDGLGGAAGDWAADTARNAGFATFHLRQPVGGARARTLLHRAARGRILLWLEPHVEVVGDLVGALDDAFADPQVGMVVLGPDVDDVLALRRALVRGAGADALGESARLASTVRGAGLRVEVRDLPVVRHAG